MTDEDDHQMAVPSVYLDPADVHILRFLRKRGPTYHINISKTIPHDISYVSRRCKYLARCDLLDRRSRTYYALTDHGEDVLTEVATDGSDEQATSAG